MTLAEAIQAAHQKNEQKLAAEVATPKVELESDALILFRRFADWCRAKGAPFLAAAPATVAAFIRSENKAGADFRRIFETVRAIEQAHDSAGLANPAATFAVRHELGAIYHIDAPRSWPKADRPLFNALPIEVRAVIERRAEQDTKALRNLQNKVAEKLKQQPKENTDVEEISRTT